MQKWSPQRIVSLFQDELFLACHQVLHPKDSLHRLPKKEDQSYKPAVIDKQRMWKTAYSTEKTATLLTVSETVQMQTMGHLQPEWRRKDQTWLSLGANLHGSQPLRIGGEVPAWHRRPWQERWDIQTMERLLEVAVWHADTQRWEFPIKKQCESRLVVPEERPRLLIGIAVSVLIRLESFLQAPLQPLRRGTCRAMDIHG